MATYVVSDVHGYYYRFMDLLKKVEYNPDKDSLYVLGDIVDRGPHSSLMCRWALENRDHVHFLLGNHEDMMLSVLVDDYNKMNIGCPVSPSIWYWNGGDSTHKALSSWSKDELRDLLNFIIGWPMFYDIKVNDRRFVLVHAGLAVDGARINDDRYAYGRQDSIKINDFVDQWSQSLLWIRNGWLHNLSEIPCDVIFGHTITNKIYNDLTSFKEELTFFNTDKTIEFIGGVGCNFIHINDKKHGIDTGRNKMGILRLDDMAEFYSTAQEEEDNG